jgi:hypothetical protein
MELPFLILLIVFGGLIGFFLANVIQSLRGGDKSAQPGARKSSALKQGEIEIARLLRISGKPGIQVEMDSQRYQSVEGLDEAQRGRLSRSLEELSTWNGLKAPAVPPAAAPSSTPAAVFQHGQEAPAVRPVSINPLDRLVSPPTRPETRLKSLAEQIDEILQEQILSSGESYPEIRLMDSPSKGLLVVIGPDRYEGIDAVPDQPMRGLILEAVREWERRTALKG